MLITRKTKVPKTWTFYATLIVILSVYGQFVVTAPFLLLIKRFIDNPAAIMGLISIQIWVTFIVGPLVAWLSDRIWTRYGRRKVFVAWSDFLKMVFLIGMPFAPNLWVLILLRWGYDFFGDLGAPGQPLVYEIVPAKQRGLSGGFAKAYLNIGNLIFFTLLLGRFDDIYFMGPFQFFTTVDGGTVMFMLCSLLFLGAAIFEVIGIKEIYPPGRKRLGDGRRSGDNIFKHFVRSVFGDIFAKDLLPLYMLLVGNIMFGFGLGMFQPLLFTEQWGYDLQTFGNTIAIGVPVGIVLGLLGGWMADRYGKLKIVFCTTIGNLVINIAYTLFVYFLPDHRPSFWEIVAFANASYIFGAIKSVATGPLLWEYVARNRMGSAVGGIMIFNATLRNSVGVLVGGWLFLWSLWFFPQAGYNITATFAEAYDEEQVTRQVQAAGLDLETMSLRPLHQYGSGGKTSSRWRIHEENKEAQALIDERGDLRNAIDNLQSKKSFIFTSEERKVEIDKEIEAARERIAAIGEALEQRSRKLEKQLEPVLRDLRYVPGNQLWQASFVDSELAFEMQTLEAVSAKNVESLIKNLRGQELKMRTTTNEDGDVRRVPSITIEPIGPEVGGTHGVRLIADIDMRFYQILEGAIQAGLPGPAAFDMAAATMAVSASQFTTRRSDFTLTDVDGRPGSGGASPELTVTLVPEAENGSTELAAAAVREIFEGASQFIEGVEVERVVDGYQLTFTLNPPQPNGKPLPYDEVTPRMVELLEMESNEARSAFAMVMFRKFAETLASPPVYVTVPQHAMVAGHKNREYEYFFASQILQIGTDFFGIGILILIFVLEKRGVLHRAGAEEDKNR